MALNRGRPKKYASDEERQAAAQESRERWAAKQQQRKAINDLPSVDDSALTMPEMPMIDPYDIAQAMRLAGLQAARFAQRVLHDEAVEVKHRLAAAGLLAARGWMDAPRDPSVLVQNNLTVFDEQKARALLERLSGNSLAHPSRSEVCVPAEVDDAA